MIKPCFYKIGDLGITNIPKCGSQTVEGVSDGLLDSQYGDKINNLIAFIRDPFERLKSLYRFINEYPGKIIKHPIPTWDLFVEWVLTTDDYHVLPQSDFLIGGEIIYPLSKMDEVLLDLIGKIPERKHQTNRIVLDTNYRQCDLKQKYKSDIDLWQQITL